MKNRIDSKLISGILVFGSFWGMIEATLGGILHLIYFPFTGTVMRSIAFCIMAVAVSATRKPELPLFMGTLAGLIKLIDLIILPTSTVKVIRPAIAIVTEGMAFGLITLFMWDLYNRKLSNRIISGLCVSYLSVIIYSVSIIAVFSYYPHGGTSLLNTFRYIGLGGARSGILSMIFLPSGYWIGNKIAHKLNFETVHESDKIYWETGIVTAFCLLTIIVSGLLGIR